MKRFIAALTGTAFGLFASWFCLYVFSQIDWPRSDRPATGCNELSHCPVHWWTYPLFFGTLLGPSVLLGYVNALAWKRWTLRRWAWTFGALTVLLVLFYLLPYASPLLRRIVERA